MHSTNQIAWALALNAGRVQPLSMNGLRGTSVMPYCTKHQDVSHVPGEGCTCALGAVPWQEGGDLQAVA